MMVWNEKVQMVVLLVVVGSKRALRANTDSGEQNNLACSSTTNDFNMKCYFCIPFILLITVFNANHHACSTNVTS